jgi:hypothetical protein
LNVLRGRGYCPAHVLSTLGNTGPDPELLGRLDALQEDPVSY